MANINTGDTALVLISAALVCLMTPGLAFFYGGLVRKKNVLTIMMQNFISMGIVTFIWVFGGFSLAFSGDIGGIIGNFKYFVLNGVGMAPNSSYGPTIPFLAFFVYQEMFAVITPALITGAFADRINFKSYLKILALWSMFVYVPVTHWIWGGGFLAKLGVIDFAGGIVVHVTAGIAALVSVIYVGKRKILSEESTAPHNIAYVALGTGLLWFGWFGFNGGSALSANGIAAIAFANTDIAGSVAMIMWLLISWAHEKKPSMIGALTGAVAGLATITPCAGYIEPWAAVIVGLLSAIVCYMAVQLREKFDLDDALDVWGVHGVGGILGSILVGVFASKSVNGINGLIYGNAHQFYVQLAGVGIVAIYTCVVTFAIFKIVDIFDTVRVDEEIEINGLDKGILGEVAYDFDLK
ncbi:ammonium transporter [Clostridium sp. P21]|uniref:Ammonium transporter n=1 Tax=Clostridium muellerianum TaxID=2716538 RepID=A0A7Y0EL37_9CLOT|nr:ammonium transporter [Clostridium muellerianum]NMM65435.1 ammonium transporter [Clostridium muellerianum]